MNKENKKQRSVSDMDKNYCCGCAACEAICPVGAIAMTLDACGFYYPKVHMETCIDCGRCVKVCAFSEGQMKGEGREGFGN